MGIAADSIATFRSPASMSRAAMPARTADVFRIGFIIGSYYRERLRFSPEVRLPRLPEICSRSTGRIRRFCATRGKFFPLAGSVVLEDALTGYRNRSRKFPNEAAVLCQPNKKARREAGLEGRKPWGHARMAKNSFLNRSLVRGAKRSQAGKASLDAALNDLLSAK